MADEKEVKAARMIARHIFALGGPDMRALPDEEIVRRVKEATAAFSEAMRHAAVSANMAAEAFSTVGKSVAKFSVAHNYRCP